MKNRNNYIDLAKGIGIILVVLGHHETKLTDYIYSFHMPLFFILSGMLYKTNLKYKELFFKKANSIIKPYVKYSFLLYFLWILVNKFQNINIDYVEGLRGIFLGVKIKNISTMDWGVQLWFLLCLFIIINYFYVISRFFKKYTIILLILFIFTNHYFVENLGFRNYWCFLTGMVCLIFYSFGYYFKEILNKETSKEFNLIIFILFFLISIIFSKLNGRANILVNNYQNYFYFIIAGVSGFLWLYYFIKLVNFQNMILYKIGKNSLFIMAFHERVMTFIKFILRYFPSIKIDGSSIIISLILSSVQIFVCLLLIELQNKIFKKEKNEEKKFGKLYY